MNIVNDRDLVLLAAMTPTHPRHAVNRAASGPHICRTSLKFLSNKYSGRAGNIKTSVKYGHSESNVRSVWGDGLRHNEALDGVEIFKFGAFSPRPYH
jgi:hypothetical protein